MEPAQGRPRMLLPSRSPALKSDSIQEVQRPSIISEGVPGAVLSLNGARPSPISCGGAEGLLKGGLAGLRPDMSHSSLPTGLRVCATVSHHSDVSDLQRRSLTLAAIAKVTRRQLVAKDDVIVQHMKGNWAGFVALVQTFGINETNARDHCAAQAARTAFQTAGALLSLSRSLPSVN